MTRVRTLICAALTLAAGACASSPPIHYLSLDDGQPAAAGSPIGVSVAVTQANLPDLIDRPQLVVRSSGHQLQISEQYEWAEPLRRQVPRVIARDLGAALDSGRVVALPIDAQDFDPDFKVMLDIQRLDVVAGQGVDLDVVWRVEPRDGRTFFGRSMVRQAIETTSGPGDYPALVAAENLALRAVAANIAEGIKGWGDDTAVHGSSAPSDSAPADLCGGMGGRDGI